MYVDTDMFNKVQIHLKTVLNSYQLFVIFF